MNNLCDEDLEKSAMKSYFILQKIKRIKPTNEAFIEEIEFIEELLFMLLSNNNQLHRALADMEHRLQVVNWSFGGMWQ